MLINEIKNHRYLLLAIVVIGLFVFGFNLDNGLFWDDDDWIINNPFVHNFSHIKDFFTKDILSGIGLKSNYYRPILLLTFAFNYVISGIKPFSYHLVSNLLHVLNGVLIFVLLQNVLKRRWLSFIAALFFVIHPLQTEAVTYISGRGDPLNVFFMLLALVFFLKKSRIWSLAFLVLAILSRETAVIFPFFFMAFYIAFLTKERFWPAVKNSFKKALPYFGVVGAYVLLRLTVLNFKNTLNFYGAENIYTENLHIRVFTFFHALLNYFKLIFAPVGLHMERDLDLLVSFFDFRVLSVLGILIGLVLWLVYLYRREGTEGISDFRIWFFGLAVFFINLGPSTGILASVNALIYEHWLYFGLFGIATIIAFYVDRLMVIVRDKKVLRLIVLVALIGYFAFLGVASAKRNLAWGEPVAFYEDILRYSPDSVRINNNLGNLHNRKDDLERAEFYYRRAIESEDTFAQPHYNIGVIRLNEGNLEEAKKEFLRAIELNPEFHYAYQNLAFIYAQEGDLASATEALEIVLEVRSIDPTVYYNLGLIYGAMGRTDDARDMLEMGIQFVRNEDERLAFEDLLTKLE